MLYPPSHLQTIRMDFLVIGLTRRQVSTAARRMTSSSSKVLWWLENNMECTVVTDADCSKSPVNSSTHNTSLLAVRSKILEDRLLRLNTRRRQIEKRDDFLKERRRTVEAMALKVLNSSGQTIDMSVGLDSQGNIRTPEYKALSLGAGGVTAQTQRQPVKQDPNLSTTVFPVPHGLNRSRSDRPDMSTVTTQTSSSLLCKPPTAPPPTVVPLVELKGYYRNGHRCTWC
ncbi:uncharacterized protein LOC124119278 [Haliotis rufescens]|uniref:uncharacterized protein LOC124119278 n=1 Tax=Haliotis rufescens TaxID=6454 RepID=UPI001EB09695|nr:uncharacterized protein LOC124119278 [Haliotis rufescens]